MTDRKVVVTGASGLVGGAALRHFADLDGWDAIGVSRGEPQRPTESATFVSLDLTDADACAAFVAEHGGDVTHVVSAALHEEPGLAPGWFDPDAIAHNLSLLSNLIDPLLERDTPLEHVSLLQGSKAYGMHHPELFEQIRTPLREREPRLDHPNFYFAQEDYLQEKQAAGAGFGVTVWRPTVVYGDAPGVNMNAVRGIAVWAALERAAGATALDYPGATYDQPFQEAVDVDLLAEALAWAATAPTARDQTFNLSNGDTFTWRHTWGAVARAFGMEEGGHRPTVLAEELPKRDAEWAALVEKHGLDAPGSIQEHVGFNSLLYADWMLGNIEGVVAPLNSTIAIREAGFNGCEDTEDMFFKWFTRVQEWGVVPAATAVTD